MPFSEDDKALMKNFFTCSKVMVHKGY